MKKLFGNRFALISYFLIISVFLITIIGDFLDIKFFYNIIDFIAPLSILLFFIWTIYFSSIKKVQSLKEKIISLSVISIPIIIVFQITYLVEVINGKNPEIYTSVLYITLIVTILFLIIPIGIHSKNPTLSIIMFALFLGFMFKSHRIPGGNYISMSVPILILLNTFLEYILIRKYNTGKSEYLRIFLLQSISYIFLFSSLWIFFGGISDLIIAQVLVYVYLIVNLFIYLIIPKSNYFKWDQKLRKRFLQYSVYLGIVFLAFAIYLSLSDTLNYDLMNFSGKSSFADYDIDLSKPIN